MPSRNAQVLVFDVNETLSDMGPLRTRFEDIGAPAHLLPLWFAGCATASHSPQPVLTRNSRP